MFSQNTRFSTVGHGIKLQLCKKIIEIHQGKIFVKNSNKNINSISFIIPNNKNKLNSKKTSLSHFQLTNS